MASILEDIRGFTEKRGAWFEDKPLGSYSQAEFDEFIKTDGVISWPTMLMFQYLGCRVTFVAQTPKVQKSIMDGSTRTIEKRYYAQSIQLIENNPPTETPPLPFDKIGAFE